MISALWCLLPGKPFPFLSIKDKSTPQKMPSRTTLSLSHVNMFLHYFWTMLRSSKISFILTNFLNHIFDIALHWLMIFGIVFHFKVFLQILLTIPYLQLTVCCALLLKYSELSVKQSFVSIAKSAFETLQMRFNLFPESSTHQKHIHFLPARLSPHQSHLILLQAKQNEHKYSPPTESVNHPCMPCATWRESQGEKEKIQSITISPKARHSKTIARTGTPVPPRSKPPCCKEFGKHLTIFCPIAPSLTSLARQIGERKIWRFVCVFTRRQRRMGSGTIRRMGKRRHRRRRCTIQP